MTQGLDPRIAEFVATFQQQTQSGMHIDGFGPGSPPPPPFNPESLYEIPPGMALDEDDEQAIRSMPPPPPPAPADPTSPLVDLARRQSAPQFLPMPQRQLELVVNDKHAMFRGQTVILTEKQYQAIAAAVLTAVAEQARELYQQLTGRLPRKAYTRKVKTEPVKRRGRKPKAANGG